MNQLSEYEIIGIERISSGKLSAGISVKDLTHYPGSPYQKDFLINYKTMKNNTENVCLFLGVNNIEKWLNQIESME